MKRQYYWRKNTSYILIYPITIPYFGNLCNVIFFYLQGQDSTLLPVRNSLLDKELANDFENCLHSAYKICHKKHENLCLTLQYVITYNKNMKEIRKTDVFMQWIQKLHDSRTRYRIFKRIERLAEGNPGDVKPAGEGISEMRIDYGPGYRVYFKDTGNEIIILLCGGDKKTQEADIIEARKIAKNYILQEDE